MIAEEHTEPAPASWSDVSDARLEVAPCGEDSGTDSERGSEGSGPEEPVQTSALRVLLAGKALWRKGVASLKDGKDVALSWQDIDIIMKVSELTADDAEPWPELTVLPLLAQRLVPKLDRCSPNPDVAGGLISPGAALFS